jgi:hypothetical protein
LVLTDRDHRPVLVSPELGEFEPTPAAKAAIDNEILPLISVLLAELTERRNPDA